MASPEIELVDLALVAGYPRVVGYIIEHGKDVEQPLHLRVLSGSRHLLVPGDDLVELGAVKGVEAILLLLLVLRSRTS